MPQGGFICPKTHDRMSFGDCLCRCDDPCHPLPTLAAAANDRPVEDRVYHVTEVWNPPKVVYLSRHQEYYLAPEATAYTMLGQAYHLLMESMGPRLASFGAHDPADLERSFRCDINTPHGKAVLAGRADRYEGHRRILWDYKTEKLYSVKKYMAGEWAGVKHVYQLNTYRTYLFPEAKKLMLSCYIKDHGFQAQWEGIPAIVNVEVPLLEPLAVRELVIAKVDELLKNEADPTTIRDCQDDELWGGKRCLEYCPVVAFCPQGQAITGKGSGAHVNHKKRTTPR